MATEITEFDYRYIILDDDPSAAATALTALWESGINLVGFSEFPHSPGRSQLDLIAEGTEGLATAAGEMGLLLSPKKTCFLIRGESRPGAVVAEILKSLADANIRVTALQAVSAGAGRFGALLWVKPPDVKATAKVLGAVVPLQETVEDDSDDEIPATEVPAWVQAHLA